MESSANHSFTYLKIPGDIDEPLEEITATADEFGDVLPKLLKSRFAGGKLQNVGGARACWHTGTTCQETHFATLATGLRSEYGSVVDEKMHIIEQQAAQGTVEVFALVRPSANTMPVPHAGTYMYFDVRRNGLRSPP